MKKTIGFLSIIVISLSLFSCGYKDNAMDFEDGQGDADELCVTVNDPMFVGYGNGNFGVFDYNTISEQVGITCTAAGIDDEEFTTKILSGDNSADIYLLFGYEAKLLLDKGLYEPIDSEIINDFNKSCFDYLSEFCLDSDRKTVFMPIYNCVDAVYVPKSAIEETALKEKDIRLLDDFLVFARKYDGTRKSYSIGWLFYMDMNRQYEDYYCDFKKGIVNYDTELYRHIYEELLSGYQRSGQKPGNMDGFVHAATALAHNYSNTLFDLSGNYGDFISESDQWRAFPMPRISEDIEKISSNTIFAYVNPYSNNKKSAVKFLEAVAENYNMITGSSVIEIYCYPFIKKDKADYDVRYNTDTELFGDVFEIVKDGYIREYSLSSFRNDIDDYQNGKLTLDEAIATYQREVKIWLNE